MTFDMGEGLIRNVANKESTNDFFADEFADQWKSRLQIVSNSHLDTVLSGSERPNNLHSLCKRLQMTEMNFFLFPVDLLLGSPLYGNPFPPCRHFHNISCRGLFQKSDPTIMGKNLWPQSQIGSRLENLFEWGFHDDEVLCVHAI